MKNIPLILAVMILALHPLRASEIPLRIEQPWVVAVPPGSRDTAAFMTLVNTGSTPLRLISGMSPVAERVAPMLTTRKNGRIGMEDVPFLEIPAGGKVTLRPGGDHLMLYGLKRNLKPGEILPFELKIKPGGTIRIEVPVLRRAPK